MNVRRFAARTSREALAMVREALGEDAVVLSTKPVDDGVEVMAMAPEGLQQAEAAGQQTTVLRAPAAPAGAGPRPKTLAERIAARGEARQENRRGAGGKGSSRAAGSTAGSADGLDDLRADQRPDQRHEGRQEPRLEPELDLSPAPAPAAAASAASALSQRMAAKRPPAAGEPAAAAQGEIDPVVARDVETLGMSTLTFQDYVRERMLRRRQAEMAQALPNLPEALAAQQAGGTPAPAGAASSMPTGQAALRVVASRRQQASQGHGLGQGLNQGVSQGGSHGLGDDDGEPRPRLRVASRRATPVLRDELRHGSPALADEDLFAPGPRPNGQDERTDVMGELREVRNLIEERFGMLAYMERLQRDPRQVALLQKLFDSGLSPGLVRKLVQALPADAADDMAWTAGVLERNLLTNEHEPALEDHHGVMALIGPTGVGKTTTTAKIAAAFAARHGAHHLGLITLDAYRVAAHEQLRTYGRILGAPVHTAHDRTSLEDLLELLAPKKLVLIDTAGVAQRDVRTRELLDMLSHRSIEKLLVVNAAVQGETIEDVLVSYGVPSCRGVILSKLDEAVKLAPAIDALIRHRAKVLGVTNGQRVPEDWHRLSAQALVQRALRGGGGNSWRLDANEVNLVFAATHGLGYPSGPPPGHVAAGSAAPQV